PVTQPCYHDRAERRRSNPRELLEEGREPGDEIVEEGREAVEDREHEARIRRVATVAQPNLEAVEVARERVPDERVGPGTRVLPAEERNEHSEHDENPEPGPATPPRALRRDRGSRYGILGCGRVRPPRRRSRRAPPPDRPRRRQSRCRPRR